MGESFLISVQSAKGFLAAAEILFLYDGIGNVNCFYLMFFYKLMCINGYEVLSFTFTPQQGQNHSFRT